MFVPYGSDAPLYHRPWATLGFVVANVALFFVTDPLAPDSRALWTLELGRFAPWQWITHAFSHADIFHLVGNMLFLGVFGLIVEGKIGWRPFVPLYLGMAVAEGLITQILTIGSGTVSLPGVGEVYQVALGASGVIFGLMVISMVWAPRNEVRCILWVFLFLIYRFELRVSTFCGFYLAINLLGALVAEFSISSSVLHLIGALTGVAPAIYALRHGLVDCEGWDLLSLRRHGWAPPGRRGAWKSSPEPEPRPEDVSRPIRDRLVEHLERGDAEAAYGELERWSSARPDGDGPSTDMLVRLAEALVVRRRFAETHRILDAVLSTRPRNARAALLDARILVDELRRPRAAMDRLEVFSPGELTLAQRTEREAIAARAQRGLDDGVLELSD